MSAYKENTGRRDKLEFRQRRTKVHVANKVKQACPEHFRVSRHFNRGREDDVRNSWLKLWVGGRGSLL